MFSLLRRDDRGFTLVELMMVIVILGILAGVSVPLIGNMRKTAWDNKLATTCDTLGVVGLAHFVEKGIAPTVDDLEARASLPTNVELTDAESCTDPAKGCIKYSNDDTKNELVFVANPPNDTSDPKTHTYKY